MERKYKVNDSAAGDSSDRDGAKSKEVALEKLRKMEWKRNTKDPWHLARSSRSSDVQERKKYNKDEDNYFEGTGVQKTKKLRRPRLSEGSPSVPPGFCVAQSSSALPQVNAWAQKKGSELFQREDEIDEEDQVMKLVLEESLKSIEEDNKRRLERLRMTNLDLPASSRTMSAEKDWEEKYSNKEFPAKRSLGDLQEDSAKAELYFVETDVKEEKPTVNQRHRSIPPRTRKTSPQEKSISPSANEKFDLPKSVSKVPSSTVNKNTRITESVEASSRVLDSEPEDDEFFEPSSPQANNSNPYNKASETPSSLSYATHSSSTILPRMSVKHANVNSDGLNSTLTFGDTQGLFEKMREDVKNLKSETSTYQSDSGSEKNNANPSEPSETDILLHSFIRHEPPSNTNSMVQSNVTDMSAVNQSEPNDLFTLHNSPAFSLQNLNSNQYYVPPQMANVEQHPVVNGLVGVQLSNGRDSSSSLSGSPLQNITPFGSLENEIPSGIRTGVQVPYPYPYTAENQESLARHLQALHLRNHNLSALNTEYSSIPTPVGGVMPVNPQVGQPQYRLPTPNMMMPSFQGHNLSPLLLQHQLQQTHLPQVQMPPGYLPQMLALDAARLQQSQLQQSQLSACVAESDDNETKEQVSINQQQIQNSNHILAQNQARILSQAPQPQISSQTQAQVLSQAQAQLLLHNKAQMMSQNQQHFLPVHLQNHPQMVSMQNQSQSVPLVEPSTPKQEELLQQHILQCGRAQQGGKSREELLQIEYQNTVQALRRLEEEMQEAQVQPTIPAAQAQPPWGVMNPSPTMPLGLNQFFPMGMVQPHLIQQSQNTGLISPTMQHTPHTLPGPMNIGPEYNLGSEIKTAQEPTQTSVGRGRGRLH